MKGNIYGIDKLQSRASPTEQAGLYVGRPRQRNSVTQIPYLYKIFTQNVGLKPCH